MIDIHRPRIFALLEIRMTGHKKLTEEFGFSNQFLSSATGHFGEIFIIYDDNNLNFSDMVSHLKLSMALSKLVIPLTFDFLVLSILA